MPGWMYFLDCLVAHMLQVSDKRHQGVLFLRIPAKASALRSFYHVFVCPVNSLGCHLVQVHSNDGAVLYLQDIHGHDASVVRSSFCNAYMAMMLLLDSFEELFLV